MSDPFETPDLSAPEADSITASSVVPETPAEAAFGSATPPPTQPYVAPTHQAPPTYPTAYGPLPNYGPHANNHYGGYPAAPGYHGGVTQAPNNGLAIAALACGIAAWFIVPVLGSIAAVILGIVALGRIRRTGERGHGMAVAGIVLGAVSLVVSVIAIIAIIAAITNYGYWHWYF